MIPKHFTPAEGREFRHYFKMPLDRYWHRVFGFDVIKFDEEIAQPPDGVSTAQKVEQDHGVEALELIKGLLSR